MLFTILLLIGLLCVLPGQAIATTASVPASHEGDEPLQRSQAAIGRLLPDLTFTTAAGLPLQLSGVAGKPLVVSLVFTSCYHVCPAITRNVATAVRQARKVLGDESFVVLTVGFDVANDTPMAMRAFASQQSIDDAGWYFLSGDATNMQQLVDTLGFSYFPTPRGFDHINQLTVVDRDGRVYRQVYGADFELPWLVEPLKELVWNRPVAGQHLLAGFADRVRLFCTVYDPRTGRYRFDYSLFVGIAVGAAFLLVLGGWWARESWRTHRLKNR